MLRSLIFMLLLIGINNMTFGQSFKHDTDALKTRYKPYLNGEVYKFLLDDSIRKYKKTWLEDEPPGVLKDLYIILNDSVGVRLFFGKLKFQEEQNFNFEWNLQLLYKEEIHKIKFYFPDERNTFQIR